MTVSIPALNKHKRFYSLPSQRMANIGKKGLCTTSLHCKIFKSRDFFELQDGIRGIYTPMNSNSMTYINTSKKLKAKWPQLW